MSLYNDASLVLIPSGYKEGKLYSIKPTDGGGDFTFSRASSATRVNSSGLIEKETQNLLLQSNTFDTTWAKTSSITLTSGQSGYDGSSDAWLLKRTASGAQYISQDKSVSGVNTYSVYAKAESGSWMFLIGALSGYPEAYFNLSNGTIGSVNGASIIDANIESVGNGWYRCSIIFNDSLSQFRIYPTDGDGSTSGTTEGIYIQDAQLNQGLVADSYLETTTTAVYGGITDNIPRLDYTDASCPSLLLEAQRTNLITQSEYFGAWANFELSIDSDFYNSPEGVNNASFAIPTTTNAVHQLRLTLSSVTGRHTQSIYAKQGGYKNLLVWDDNTSGGIGVNLDDLSIFRNENNSGYDVQDVGNGWVRISVTHNYSAQAMLPAIYIYDNSATPQISFTADGTSGIYVYGAQLEAGSVGMAMPTSYIPTYGTAVTRIGENSAFELSVFDFFSLSNTESGTFFIETKFINQGNPFVDTFSQGGSGTSVWQNTDFVMLDTVSANSFVVQNITSVIDDYVKILIRKDQTTYNVFINGVKSATTNTITNPLKWFDHIATFRNTQMVKQMIEFPTALTDSECIALTTL